MIRDERNILLCVVFIFILPVNQCTKLNDYTSSVFPGNQHGIVAAFGDFNADRLVDIFVLNQERNLVDILFAQEEKEFSRYQNITTVKSNGIYIDGIIPSDFNGDAKMDILLCLKSNDGLYKMDVHWGNGKHGVTGHSEVPVKFRDHPAVVDFNGDLIPDILGETEGNERIILFGGSDFKTNMTLPHSDNEFQKPQSCAFVDMNSDLTPDLIITTVNGYEVWINMNGNLELNQTIPLPPNPANDAKIFPISVTDINRDGKMDILVPACSAKCSESSIFVYKDMQWSKMNTGFVVNDQVWNFIPSEDNLFADITLTPKLHLGDYNIDGYPDAVVVLRGEIDGEMQQQMFLLENVLCSSDSCQSVTRQFDIDHNSALASEKGVVLASFFDLLEDGVLDVVAVSMTGTKESSSKYPVMSAFKQTPTADACFLKVTVTSGLCNNNCPDGQDPFGVNQPGPSVQYSTTSVHGEFLTSQDTQLSQMSHSSLQLPYTLFGLGMMPNFVDKVTVGIATNTSKILNHEWPQIIPNSQLVVIPSPYDSPESWVLKLFVTPSKAVLITGAALLGACGFVAGIIGILHWKEKREDKEEKRQESHKFHFDAM